jgi:single-strand DNA-binding protein
MSSVNRVIIVGNLGQDPTVNTSQAGNKIVNLSVATSDRWSDKSSGEKKERTEWHRVVIFGSGESDGLASVAEKYLKKGSKVYVSGKLQTRKWTDKEGVERYSTEIVLSGFGAELVLLDKQGNGGPPPASSPDDYGRTNDRSDGGGSRSSSDDEIPF